MAGRPSRKYKINVTSRRLETDRRFYNFLLADASKPEKNNSIRPHRVAQINKKLSRYLTFSLVFNFTTWSALRAICRDTEESQKRPACRAVSFFRAYFSVSVMLEICRRRAKEALKMTRCPSRFGQKVTQISPSAV